MEFRQIAWAEFFDEENKVPYYVNIHSNATQSEIPAEMKEWKDEYINDWLSKSNWRKREHEGKYFYYDKLTGTSVWEPPAELVEFESSLVQVSQQRFQEAARRKAQSSSTETVVQDDYNANDDNWVMTGSGSDYGFDSDRTPPDQSPNMYSPQYEGSGEEDVEGGYFYDEQQDFGSTGQEDQMDISMEVAGTETVASAEQSQEEQAHQRRAEILLLEKKLSARDAIMEPGLYALVARYLLLTEKHPQEVVSALCKGYVGYAQLTHVVCDWIQLAEQEEEPPKEGSTAAIALKESQESQTNQFIADEVAGLIKSRFDATLADKLMDERVREPEWLVDMMQNPTESMWRRLLIKLSDEHRESILLNWCIRELSQLGYHREIAQVIREADYFSVCNALLVDTIFRLGSAIAEGGATYSDIANGSDSGTFESRSGGASGTSNHDNVASLMIDLKRMCGSSEYMFIYTQFLLSEILNKLSSDANSINSQKRSFDETQQQASGETSSNSTDDPMKDMWRHKVRRIQDELEDHLVWQRDVRGFSSRGWRVDTLSSEAKFALQLTNGNESIGIYPDASATAVDPTREEVHVQTVVHAMLENGFVTKDAVETVFGHFFQRCEVEVDIDTTDREASAEVVKLLPGVQAALTKGSNTASDSSFARILHHPQFLHMLIMHLVGGGGNAGSSSSNGGVHNTGSSSSTWCYSVACLLALAAFSNVINSNDHCKSSISGVQDAVNDEVIALAKKISHAREICLNLGSLSSNLYTSSKSDIIFDYMKQSSLLSSIFLSWLEMKIHESLFVIRAKQLAVYPVIMQMLVVGMNTYVSQRHQCVQIIKNTFTVVSQVSSSEDASTLGGGLDRDSHREKDISETSLSIRQDLVDLLIHLIGKGFISEPFLFLQENIDSMDKALIRSFFVKLFGVTAAPYSNEFVRALTQVLLLPRAKECVESTYFSSVGAKGLQQFRDDAFGPPGGVVGEQRKETIVHVEQMTLLDTMVLNSMRIAKGTA